MSVAASDVLKLLDERGRELAFRAMDNGYIYPIGSRLHLYSDREKWALLIEVLTYNPRHGPVLWDELDCHGDGCGEDGLAAVHERLRVEPSGDGVDRFPDVPSVRIGGAEVPAGDLAGAALQEAFREIALRADGCLFASEAALQGVLRQPLPSVLTLEEWHHPDIVGGELPSDTRTFRQIADVIARADPSVYQPEEQPNSHWSHWPDAGTL